MVGGVVEAVVVASTAMQGSGTISVIAGSSAAAPSAVTLFEESAVVSALALLALVLAARAGGAVVRSLFGGKRAVNSEAA